MEDEAEKAKKVAAAKKKLAAFRKSKKSKKKDPLAGNGDMSDTASEVGSEASFSTMSESDLIPSPPMSADYVSAEDSASDGMAEDTLVGQINASVIEKELVYYERRVAELEELVSGKDAALRSMSEDLERLQSGAGDSNAVSDEQEVQSLQVETQKLAAHLQHYQVAVAERDLIIQQLTEKVRQIENTTPQPPSEDIDFELDSLRQQVTALTDQLGQANAALARQAAPSPQPILDAKSEIISLQQNLATREHELDAYRQAIRERDAAITQLSEAVQLRDRTTDQLKSEIAEKDERLQALGMKFSKKQEEMSELAEQCDLLKAKDDESSLIIEALKQAAGDRTHSEVDSIASGSITEEEMEERQQGLRNELDEQFGQNMMAMKESLNEQFHDTQRKLESELEHAMAQVKNWEAWGQQAQAQFQQQLQQQILTVTQQLAEKHSTELAQLKQSSTLPEGERLPTPADDLVRLRAQHQEEMQVLVDTAEEESTSLREQISRLETQLEQLNTRPQQNGETDSLSTGQVEQLGTQLRAAIEKIAKTNQEKIEAEAQLSETQQQLSVRDQEFSKVGGQLTEITSRNTALRSENAQLENRLVQLNTELTQAQSSLAKLSEEAEALREAQAEGDSSLQVMETKLNSLQTENFLLEKELSALRTEREPILPEPDQLHESKLRDAEDEEMRTDDFSAQKDQLEADLTKLREENEELVSSKSNLQEELGCLQNNFATLKEKMELSVAHEQTLAANKNQFAEEISSLSEERNALKQQKDSLLERNKVMEEERNILRDERNRLQVEAAKRESTGNTELSEMQQERDRLTTQIEELIAEKSTLEASHNSMKQERDDLDLRAFKLQEQIENISQQYKTEQTALCNERNSLLMEQNSNQNARDDFKVLQDALLSEKETLKSALEIVTKERDELCDEKVMIQQRAEEAKSELVSETERFTEQLDHLCVEKESLLIELENMRENLSLTTEGHRNAAEASKKMVTDLERKCEKLTSERELLVTQIKELIAENKIELASLRDERDNLLGERNSDRNELDELKVARDALLSEKENLQSALESMTKERDEFCGQGSIIQQKFEDAEAQLVTKTAQLTEQFNQARDEKESALVELEKLRKDFIDETGSHQQECEALVSKIASLQTAAEALSRERDELLSQQQLLQSAMETQIKHSTQVLGEKAELQQQCEEVKQQYAELRFSADELKAELSDLRGQYGRLLNAHTVLKEQMEVSNSETEQKLLKELDRTRAELESAIKEKIAMKREVEQIREELGVIQSVCESTKLASEVLQSQKDTQDEVLKETSKRFELLENELSTAITEKELLQQSLDTRTQQFSSEKEVLVTQCHQLSIDKAALTAELEVARELSTSEKELRQQASEALNKASYELQGKCEAFTIEISTLQTENRALSSDRDSLLSTQESLQAQLEAFETKLKLSAEEKLALEDQVEAAILKNSELTSSADSLKIELADLQRQNSRLMDAHALLKEQIETSNSETEQKLLNEVDQVHGELESAIAKENAMERELDQVRAELSALQIKWESVKLANEVLEAEKVAQDGNFHEYTEKIKTLEAEATQLLFDKESLQQTNAAMKKELSGIAEELQNVLSSHSDLLTQFNSLTEQQESLQTELETSKAKAEEYELQLATAEGVLLSKDDQIQSLSNQQQAMQKSKEEYQDELHNKQQIIETLEDAAQEFAAERKGLQSYITELERDRSTLQTSTDDVNAELIEVKRALKAAEDNLKNHQDLQSYIAELEAVRTALQASVDDGKTELESIKVSLQTERQTVSLLQTDLEAEKQTIASLRACLKDEQEKMAVLCKDLDAAKESSTTLQTNLLLAENNVLETNREKTTTLEQNELLKYELKELRARLKDVESAPREQSSHAEDLDMAVNVALRQQKMELDGKHADALRRVADELAAKADFARKQVESELQQKFVSEMQAVKYELVAEREQKIKDLKLAFSQDSTRKMQDLYDDLEEKQQTIAVLNRELERAQKANAQLSEETMELEQARAEKAALQAQLDKVQDELEDMDRVAEPQGFTDQERLLMENPTLVDQVEDSEKFHSLRSENEQLKALLEELRQSDAAKLRQGYEQMRLENEELRQRLESSPPELAGVTDSTKEIDNLKMELAQAAQTKQELFDHVTAVRAQYTQLEAQYRILEAELANRSPRDGEDGRADLIQQIQSLTAHCQNYESKSSEMISELETMRKEKEGVISDLTTSQQKLLTTQQHLAAVAAAYQEMQARGDSDTVVELRRQLVASQADQEQIQSLLEKTQGNLEAAVAENTALSERIVSAQASPALHSTPRDPAPAAELYDGTTFSEDNLSSEMAKLRQDLDNLQTQYSTDTASLRRELEAERQRTESIRDELHQSLNISNDSTGSLADMIEKLQKANERLVSDKEELNRQLGEQERLCAKLHERVASSENLSSSLQESYSRQLSAAQTQRDDILRQLDEACRVNAQVSALVAERPTRADRADLETKLERMREQLEHLSKSHHQLTESLNTKAQTGLEIAKQNSVLEEAVKKMEARLQERERALEMERVAMRAREETIERTQSAQRQYEFNLTEERLRHSNDLQMVRATSDQNTLDRIRETRKEIESKYAEAINKLRRELHAESRQKQESLRKQHKDTVEDLELRHAKQLEETQSQFDQKLSLIMEQVEQLSRRRNQTPKEDLESLREQLEKDTGNILDELSPEQQVKMAALRVIWQQLSESEVSAEKRRLLDEFETMKQTLEEKLAADSERKLADCSNSYAHEVESLRSLLEQEVARQTEELQQELQRIEEQHQRDANQLKDEHAVALLEAQTITQERLESELAALRQQHRAEVSDLHDKHTRQQAALTSQHEEELRAARSMLSISHALDQDYRSMRTEVEELRNQLEAQTLAVNRLTGERDALLQQSSESRERMASIHSTEMGELEADLKSQFSQMIVQLQANHESLTDDYHQLQEAVSKHNVEMDELRQYFEEKVNAKELSYIEEISALKEKHQQELGYSFAMHAFLNDVTLTNADADEAFDLEVSLRSSTAELGVKPYHTRDSMTESLSARERDYIKQATTLTVLSDLDSSDGSLPRMTVADMEESIVAETARTLETAPINDDAYLGASSDSLLAHLTELQHQLEQEMTKAVSEELAKELMSSVNAQVGAMKKTVADRDAGKHRRSSAPSTGEPAHKMDFQAELQLLKDENNELKVKLDELENEKLTLQEEVTSTAARVKELLEAQKALETHQAQVLEDNVNQHKTEIVLLTEQMSAANEALQTTINALEQEKAQLSKDNAIMEEAKRALDEEILQLKTDLETDKRELNDNLKAVQEDLTSLTSQHAKKLSEIQQRSDEDQSALRDEITTLKAEIADHAAVCEELETTRATLAATQQQVGVLSQELDHQFDNQKQYMVEHRNLMQSTLDTHNKELADRTQQVKSLEGDKSNLQELNRQLIQKCKSFKQDLAKAERKLEDENMTHEYTIHKLNTELKAVQAHSAQNFASHKAQLEEFAKQIAESNLETEAISQRHAGEVKKLQEEIESQKNKWREEADDLDTAHTAEIVELNDAHCAQLKEIQDTLSTQLDRMTEEIAVLQADQEAANLRHSKQIFSMETELATVREESQAESAAHEAEVKSMEQHLSLEQAEYRSKLQAAENRIKDLQQQLQHQQRQSQETNEVWVKNMAEVTQDFNAIRAENKAALDELAKKYETQITDLKEHIQKLSVDGNDKDSIIKQLRCENERLKDQIATSATASDLVGQLKSDLESLEQDRERVQTANNRLLALLSDGVQTQRNLEKKVMGCLGPDDSHSSDRLTGPAEGGARGGPDPPEHGPGGKAEQSFDSQMDEGLDLSNVAASRHESIFPGPTLDITEEDLIADANTQLQRVVEMLLNRIDTVTSELNEAKREQEILISNVSQKEGASALQEQKHSESQQELELHSTELAQELTNARDMIRELTEARLLLEQTVEAREADYQQLQEESAELRQRLDVLESERHAVQAMREHVESQHEALTEGAGPAEKKLLRMNSELELEKANLMANHQDSISILEEKIKELEAALEDAQEEIDAVQSDRAELRQELESVKRSIERDRQFMEEQSREREVEREEAAKLKLALEETRKEVKKKEEVIESKESQIADLMEFTQVSEIAVEDSVVSHDASRAELEAKDSTIAEMRRMQNALESELELKIKKTADLERQLEELQTTYSLEKTEYAALPATNAHLDQTMQELGSRLEETLRTVQMLREDRDALQADIDSLKLENEEALQEKATLQSSVYEHLNTISSLRSQLESRRHTPTEPQSNEELMNVQEALELKEQEVVELTEELATLRAQLETAKSVHEVETTEFQEIDQLRDTVSSLQSELERQRRESTTNSASIDDLMKQLIDEKDEEILLLRHTLQSTDSTAQVQQQIADLEEKLAAKEQTVTELEIVLTEKIAEVDEINTLLEVQRSENKKLEEYSKMEIREGVLLGDFDAVDSMLKEKDAELSKVSATQEELEDEKLELSTAKAELEQQVLVLNKELKEARNKINEQEEDGYVLGEKLTTLETDVANTREEVTTLNEKLTEVNNELAKARADLDEARADAAASVERVTSEMSYQLVELRSEFEAIGQEKTSLEAKLAALKGADEKRCESMTLVEKNARLELERINLETENATMKEQLTNTEQQLQRIMAQHEADRQRIADENHQRIQHFTTEHAENLANAQREHTQQVETIRGQHEERLQQLQLQLTEAQERIEALTGDVSELTELKGSLESKLEATLNETDTETLLKLCNFEHSNKELRDKVNALTKVTHELEAELKKITSERDELDIKVESLRNHSEQIKQELSERETINEECVQLIETLEGKTRALEEKLSHSHDSEYVDRKLEELQIRLQDSDESRVAMLERDLLRQRETYEATINQLTEQLLANAHNLTAAVSETSTLDISLKEKLAHLMNGDSDAMESHNTMKENVEKLQVVSKDIYGLSVGPFSDELAQALLQEKEALQQSVQALKDLLTRLDNTPAAMNQNGESFDWRAQLIEAVHEVFSAERANYLAELRTFVATNGDANQADRLTRAINKLATHQDQSLNCLYAADRQSLLNEIHEHQALLRQLSADHKDIAGELKAAIDAKDCEIIALCDAVQAAENTIDTMRAECTAKDVVVEKREQELMTSRAQSAHNAEQITGLRSRCQQLETELASTVAQASNLKDTLASRQKQISHLQGRIEDQEQAEVEVTKELDEVRALRIEDRKKLAAQETKSANLSAALDLARAEMMEEIRREREVAGQLRREAEVQQDDIQRLEARLLSEKRNGQTLRNDITQLQEVLEENRQAHQNYKLNVAQDISNLQHEREARAEAESANQTLRALLADTEAIVAEKEAIIAAQHRDIVKMRHHTRVDVRDDGSKESLRSIHQRLKVLTIQLQEITNQAGDGLGDVSVQLNHIDSMLLLNSPPQRERDVTDSTANLMSYIEKLAKEKQELRSVLCKMEEELARYKSQQATNGALKPYWRNTIRAMYSRMRKAESKVRSLSYQKGVILLQLGGYQEGEAEVLARLASMGALTDQQETAKNPRRRFRAAARAIIAIRRMQFIRDRSRRLDIEGVERLYRGDKENQGGARHHPSHGSQRRSAPTRQITKPERPHPQQPTPIPRQLMTPALPLTRPPAPSIGGSTITTEFQDVPVGRDYPISRELRSPPSSPNEVLSPRDNGLHTGSQLNSRAASATSSRHSPLPRPGTGLDRLSPARSQNGSPHDDSVAHNIESLERIQAKLTGIAK